MKVTILDTKTGTEHTREYDYEESWWTDGNGSCDCNRQIFCGLGADDSGECLGAKRFLVTKVEGSDLPLREFNSLYPGHLLKSFGIPLRICGACECPVDDNGCGCNHPES